MKQEKQPKETTETLIKKFNELTKILPPKAVKEVTDKLLSIFYKNIEVELLKFLEYKGLANYKGGINVKFSDQGVLSVEFDRNINLNQNEFTREFIAFTQNNASLHEVISKATFTEWAKILDFKDTTFGMPSHPVMFTLLAMFSGKPEKIPRKLLEKPHRERTDAEKRAAEEFINNILETDTKYTYNEYGQQEKDENKIALICNNPKIEASAQIDATLFNDDLRFREESLALYIKKTFGAEGLRHLLALIIGLEENFRQGYFDWTVNEHLERLGYKKKQKGSFDPEIKKTATEIVKIFTSLFITAKQKAGSKEVIQGERLFSIDGFKIESFNKEIINERLKLRATDFWYKNAFEPKDGQDPQYTKLLKQIAQENHRNHPLTIYLTPLLAIFWRMNPDGRSLKVKSLLDWCNIDYKPAKDAGDFHRMDRLRDLEAELNYMKERGYLGDWINITDLNNLPSCSENPFECVLDLRPPEWLREEMKAIKDNRAKILITKEKDVIMEQDEFDRLVQASGLKNQQFANHLGISKQMVGYIRNGKRKISPELNQKIKEVFGYLLPA